MFTLSPRVVAAVAGIICLTIVTGWSVAAAPYGDGVVELKAQPSDTVIFNLKNNKYHAPSCIWAVRCTSNCVPMTRKEAHARGGVPCKVCGGGED